MKIVAYSLCAINSLLLLLMAVDYLFVEVDLFLWVWMLSVLLFVTVPLGLAFFVYSLFHLRHKEGRVVAIWTLAMAAVVFVVFWLLPSGVSRVPAKMEAHCLQHEDHMLSLAHRLYSAMPDSTRLEYTPSGGVSIECIDTVCNIWGHPIVKDSCRVDSGALVPIPADSIDRNTLQAHGFGTLPLPCEWFRLLLVRCVPCTIHRRGQAKTITILQHHPILHARLFPFPRRRHRLRRPIPIQRPIPALQPALVLIIHTRINTHASPILHTFSPYKDEYLHSKPH